MTQIFALAFDHRNSLRRDFMHLTGQPAPEQHATMVAAKGIVTDALIAAAPQVTPDRAVLLIDHEYGGRFVAEAQAAGVKVAMPVEESGQAELRYLCDGHPERVVDAHHPDYVKVLIRYNPGGDTAMNARQRARLRQLSDWLDGRPERLMLELLVPPEPAQLAAVADDQSRFDRESRAALTVRPLTRSPATGSGRRCGRSRGRSPSRTPRASPRRCDPRTPTPGASCWAAGPTTPQSGAGWPLRRRPMASPGSPSAGRSGGTRCAALPAAATRDAAVCAVAARYLDLVRYYRAAESGY